MLDTKWASISAILLRRWVKLGSQEIGVGWVEDDDDDDDDDDDTYKIYTEMSCQFPIPTIYDPFTD